LPPGWFAPRATLIVDAHFLPSLLASAVLASALSACGGDDRARAVSGDERVRQAEVTVRSTGDAPAGDLKASHSREADKPPKVGRRREIGQADTAARREPKHALQELLARSEPRQHDQTRRATPLDMRRRLRNQDRRQTPNGGAPRRDFTREVERLLRGTEKGR
jgi:hypothetical protein